MTAGTHDTFVALDRGTPALFAWSARLLPVALTGQFFLAGQSLFADLPWSIHGMVGGMAAVPIIVMAAMAFAMSYLRGFAWWAFGILALYGVQIALATGSAAPLQCKPAADRCSRFSGQDRTSPHLTHVDLDATPNAAVAGRRFHRPEGTK